MELYTRKQVVDWITDLSPSLCPCHSLRLLVRMLSDNNFVGTIPNAIASLDKLQILCVTLSCMSWCSSDKCRSFAHALFILVFI